MILGNTSLKKLLSFGHCPNEGGEGPARIFLPLFYHVLVPKIGNLLPKTLNICMLFGNFLLSLSSKLPSLLSLDRHYHNWHFFCHTRKTLFLTSEKRGTSCPNWGEGGGEVIRAMPERKHSLFCEVFPKPDDVSVMFGVGPA